MKIQLAYKVTGEKREDVINILEKIVCVLKKRGHEIYCPILDKKTTGLSSKKSIENAFNKIDNCDAFLIFVNSEDKSEGLLLETGYAIAKKKKIILAINENVKFTRLRYITEDIINFINIDDLLKRLEEVM